MGNYADAEKVLRQAVAINPKHPEARYHLGFVLARQGKLAEARAELEKAVALDPNSSEARFQLASVLRSMGQPDQAREELKVVQAKKAEDVRQDVAGVSGQSERARICSPGMHRRQSLFTGRRWRTIQTMPTPTIIWRLRWTSWATMPESAML